MRTCVGRDVIGDSAIIGDDRWAGTLGIRADFVARTHCSVAYVSTTDIAVPSCLPSPIQPYLRNPNQHNQNHKRYAGSFPLLHYQ